MADEGFDFSQAKVAIVTGGGSGIGRAICMGVARRGVRAVIVADVDTAGAEETVQLIKGLGLGTATRAVRCDVSSAEEVDRLIGDTEKQEGLVDAFFANAGISGDQAGGVQGASLELWERQMGVNVYQTVHAARRLLPDLAHRKGCFAVTSSAAGLLMAMGAVAYTTTKHASRALAEWLSVTYGGMGLRVACLCPQAVETKMTAGGSSVAGLDGMLSADVTSESLLKSLEQGKFLALPHSEVENYIKRKAEDIDRWIKGMRRSQAKFPELLAKL